ncbi:MAG: tetratricopeptide repeat protein [Gemmatimonadales bacterium]
MAGGCGRAADLPAPVTAPPPTAQAISLLGDTLWSVSMTVEQAQVQLARLQRAREIAQDKPEDANAQLNLVRRTAQMGRLREAIGLSTKALERHNFDARLYRLRGELLLQTRRLDYAIRDLQAAGRLTITDSTSAEYIDVPGVGLVKVGLRFSVLQSLGQAFFSAGRYREAALSFEQALAVVGNVDEAAEAAVWLSLTYQRQGRWQEAMAVASAWKPDAAVVLRDAEHHLLMAWQGTVSADSLAASGVGYPSAEALHQLAAGVIQLARGALDEASALFRLVLRLGAWT